MNVSCVWEHNGSDILLYAADYPGAFSRGTDLPAAIEKMEVEIKAYLTCAEKPVPETVEVRIVQDASCDLAVKDADSDVLFNSECAPLSWEEYKQLKELALRSSETVQKLYDSITEKELCADPVRRTFYGQVPRTAGDMYRHTKSVNAYYFGELGIDADKEGSILECRTRGFSVQEGLPGFLELPPVEGSFGEWWSVRRLFRRFLWHDRIHGKAMYRMARKNCLLTGGEDPFFSGMLLP